MAWETRGTNRYYYRKRWVNGRVVSEYIGAGAFAELSAEMDAHTQQEQATSRAAWQTIVESTRNAERALAQVEVIVRMLTGAVLVVNGYHSHKRQWRRLAAKQEKGNE